MELVRYIHLNPLRGRLVRHLGELDHYPYAGHSVLMGKQEYDWQATDFVLGQFGRRVGVARRAYSAFVKAGIPLGRKPELVGGGLIRSLGGWMAVKTLGKGATRLKGDERILGDSDFVLDVLEASEERLRRQDRLQRQGCDMDWLARQVATVFGIGSDDIYQTGKRPILVSARSVFCYWAVRELRLTMTAVARALRLTQPAVSIAVRRGERIAMSRGIRLDDA